MYQKEFCSFGIFTLVSYVPAPLGPFLDELRKSTPGERYPQSHITLVPPRPLRVPLKAVLEFAQETLDGFSVFRVLLGDVHSFPETNLLYLNLVKGQDEVHLLHDALNRSVLAHEELFEFRPHLTVGGPVRDGEMLGFQQRLSDLWLAWDGGREFRVQETVALWSDGAEERPEWTRVWSRQLRGRANTRSIAATNDQT